MIWIIGGTSDAVKIAERLSKKKIFAIVSCTTTYGAGQHVFANISVICKAFTIEEMQLFVTKKNISTIIDASHPFAVEVSTNAIATAQILGIKYIRYERESYIPKGTKTFTSYDQIIDYLSPTKGKILLTIGSKNVNLFKDLKARIVARVLPAEESIKECKQAGLLPNQIIAMKGLSSIELQKAIIDEFNIKHLVTKESGPSGGTVEKLTAAKNCGIETLMLIRPHVNYPTVISSLEELENKIKLL